MARRKSSGGDDEGGGANWMDTYGDLVTLLLCFFVLLFAFSSIDAKKWEALVGAFSGTTAITIPQLDPMAIKDRPIELIPRTEDSAMEELSPVDVSRALLEHEALQQLYKNMSEYVEEHELPVVVSMDPDAFQVVIRFNEHILFDSGKAVLKQDSIPMLDKVVHGIQQNIDLVAFVDIQGHTDNVPIDTFEFPSNWSLSNKRAEMVLMYILGAESFDPARLSCRGFGEYHPVADNDTSEGRALNRRVDFVLQAYYSNVFGSLTG